jgi:chemotaxis protein methyltransferase CheR
LQQDSVANTGYGLGGIGQCHRIVFAILMGPPAVMLDIHNIQDAQTLAQAIVNTIPEPFLVLDDRLCVLTASPSFYRVFKVDPGETQGHLLYSLGDGQWDIPALRLLLDTIIPEHTAMEGFAVEHDFPGIGRRTMLLNARRVIYENSTTGTILLAFTDITDRLAIEREKEKLARQTDVLLAQKEVLLQEMQHRVANSLQIIASILLLKARAVTSAETRLHLQDAHQRVMSVAEVQRHLHASTSIDQIEVGSYLAKLCASLSSSMIGDSAIAISVEADKGLIGSDKAVSLGLIVTELLINGIKYAFPESRPDATIVVSYKAEGDGWVLTIADNGIGKAAVKSTATGGGLGTAIVLALVNQLEAQIVTASSPAGTVISITRADADAGLPSAA